MVVAVVDLFSKRQKRARGEIPDVYVYDNLTGELRQQIVYIIQDAFESIYASDICYQSLGQTLCREYGISQLTPGTSYSKINKESIFSFFLHEKSVERALDVVELSFGLVHDRLSNGWFEKNNFPSQKTVAENALQELNERFKEHGVGYQFESGEIIRVDSQYLHTEAVKPTLTVLSDPDFKGANEEFLKAHEHYRHGRYKECLVEALKAFESTMQTICKLRGWPVQPKDTAKNLIDICMRNGLFPAYFDSQFSSMRSLLESGIPTVRNKNAGHGQGTTPIEVPEYLARYTLNLTATTILFMVEAHQAAR